MLMNCIIATNQAIKTTIHFGAIKNENGIRMHRHAYVIIRKK